MDMSKVNNKVTGDFGERLAKEYLEKKNYNILETNFRTRLGEIDIIAKKDDVIVFVEVKARKTLKYGRPYESVNHRKMQKIIKVAQNYIAYKSRGDNQYRFDIVEVFLSENDKINHIEDAFWL